jgi:hypothetical protein
MSPFHRRRAMASAIGPAVVANSRGRGGQRELAGVVRAQPQPSHGPADCRCGGEGAARPFSLKMKVFAGDAGGLTRATSPPERAIGRPKGTRRNRRLGRSACVDDPCSARCNWRLVTTSRSFAVMCTASWCDHVIAGPDEVRGAAPNQRNALEAPCALRVLPVPGAQPVRHHLPSNFLTTLGACPVGIS